MYFHRAFSHGVVYARLGPTPLSETQETDVTGPCKADSHDAQ